MQSRWAGRISRAVEFEFEFEFEIEFEFEFAAGVAVGVGVGVAGGVGDAFAFVVESLAFPRDWPTTALLSPPHEDVSRRPESRSRPPVNRATRPE